MGAWSPVVAHHVRFTFRLEGDGWQSWIDKPGDGFGTYQHRAGPGLWAVGGHVDPALTAWEVGREAAYEASRQAVLEYVEENPTVDRRSSTVSTARRPRSAVWVPPLRPMSSASPRRLHSVDQDNVSATLTVAVPAARVFAVLADPTIHSAIDGTGWVQEAVDQAQLTDVGQVFRMDMYHPNHPDGGYQVANKVAVFDPPRAIGWLTGQEKDDGHLEFGGWNWRYDLEPLGLSDTEVTLTYDWSAVPQFIREYIQFPPFGPEHLTNSLHHLAVLAAPTSQARTPSG